MVKNLVKVDREGDFLLHINTVDDLLPVFNGCDSVHYVRCASFYHEQLKSLNSKFPTLYAEFLKGSFVVKTTQCTFSAVSGDMKLEQTIEKSYKTYHGIIGQTMSLSGNYYTMRFLVSVIH